MTSGFRPAVLAPVCGIIKIDRKRLQVLVDETRGMIMRQQFKNRRRAKCEFFRERAEQAQAMKALGERIAAQDRSKGVHQSFVGSSQHDNSLNVRCTGPVWRRGHTVLWQISIAIHGRVPGDEPSHRMCDDVEAQIRSIEYLL